MHAHINFPLVKPEIIPNSCTFSESRNLLPLPDQQLSCNMTNSYLYISNESVFVFYPCRDTFLVQWERLQLIYKAAKAFELKVGQMHLPVLAGTTLGIPHLAIVGAPARVRR